MDEEAASHRPYDSALETATQKLTPSAMNQLLAGAHADNISDWQPPEVATLQKLLPRHGITAFIARGGMGAVYKGVQHALNRTVAIKILPLDAVAEGGPNFAKRFKHEAQAMARLSHPAIVTVFEAGETEDGLLYFVMEHIEGTDLAHILQTEGRLEPARVIPIITTVCEALAFAHEEGVIHRDIKPSNVMIDKRGRVKVADFGLAKTLNTEKSPLTNTAMQMGTADFIAPEAMTPGMEVDQRADIYAVGVMLYQLLTGHLPRGKFDLPSTIDPQLNVRFDEIVNRALQSDRQKRYSSAMEMKVAVEGASPASAAAALQIPASARGKAARWFWAASVVVLLFGGAWGYDAFTRKEAPAPAPATRKHPPPKPTGVWIPVTFQTIDPRAGKITLQPDGALRVHHGFTLPGVLGKNLALKAQIRRASHVRFTGLMARMAGPHRIALQVSPTKAWLDTVTPSMPPSTAITLQPEEGVQTPASVQLTVVGSFAYGSLNGSPIPPLRVDLQAPGGIGIWSGDGEFSGIEVMLLDDLPEAEALRLAGVKTENGE